MISLRWIVVAVLALPFVELFAFAAAAGRIGFLAALVAVVATSLAGVVILKDRARRLFDVLRAGRPLVFDAASAREGLMTALAGLLLAIPGFVTDAAAIALFLATLLQLRRHGPVTTSARPTPPGVIDLEREAWRDEPPPGAPPGPQGDPRRLDGPRGEGR